MHIRLVHKLLIMMLVSRHDTKTRKIIRAQQKSVAKAAEGAAAKAQDDHAKKMEDLLGPCSSSCS